MTALASETTNKRTLTDARRAQLSKAKSDYALRRKTGGVRVVGAKVTQAAIDLLKTIGEELQAPNQGVAISLLLETYWEGILEDPTAAIDALTQEPVDGVARGDIYLQRQVSERDADCLKTLGRLLVRGDITEGIIALMLLHKRNPEREFVALRQQIETERSGVAEAHERIEILEASLASRILAKAGA